VLVNDIEEKNGAERREKDSSERMSNVTAAMAKTV